MKILKKDKLVSKNLIRYAQEEKTILTTMSHPFIVKLKYAFQSETKLFLVLDFCIISMISLFFGIKCLRLRLSLLPF